MENLKNNTSPLFPSNLYIFDKQIFSERVVSTIPNNSYNGSFSNISSLIIVPSNDLMCQY